MKLEENKDRLLLIFTRNPKLGKCKTRLAAAIGDQAALDIYMILLQHTAKITKDLNCSKEVYYSEEIPENDLWDLKNLFFKMFNKSRYIDRSSHDITLNELFSEIDFELNQKRY